LLLQVPNLDAAASTKTSVKQRGIPKSLRMLAAGLVDLLRTAVGREPLYLPLAGLHGSLAFMQMTPSELERYHANHPKNPQVCWEEGADRGGGPVVVSGFTRHSNRTSQDMKVHHVWRCSEDQQLLGCLRLVCAVSNHPIHRLFNTHLVCVCFSFLCCVVLSI
jgi:hypothetical protein